MRLIGTAGHIDHGKSTLVEALSGIHPSHLPEEHARGMTIDLGYAYLQHPDGYRLGIVDVPGHEKLVKNMVAGATGFELALWVVDARESVMPQTREHLQILDLLGVRSLIPVITKADLADDAQVSTARRDVATLLARVGIPTQPVHVVDSVSGRGMAELREAIFASSGDSGDGGEADFPYLPVDRVFTVRGIGTVVTGTLVRGRLAEGDNVSLTSRPGVWRVRSLHNHHERVRAIGAGHRVGINIAGLAADEVRRGDTLVGPEYPYMGRFLNVAIRWVQGAPTAWKHGARLHFHAGSAEAECRLWGAENDGGRCWAQVELRNEAAFFPGQRFILRGTTPLATVGGGEVLDLAPDRRRRVTPAERVAYRDRESAVPRLAAYITAGAGPVLSVSALARRWMVPEPDLEREAEASVELCTAADEAGRLLVWCKKWEAELLARFQVFVAGQPPGEALVPYGRLARELKVPSVNLAALLHAVLSRDGSAWLTAHVRLDRNGCVLYPGRVLFSAEDQRIADAVLERLRVAGLRPPRTRELGDLNPKRPEVVERVIAKLHDQGRVVRVAPDIVLHPEASQELRSAPARLGLDGVRAAEFGQALGLSRKYTIPFLEYLNEIGVLRRDGDLHFRS